MKLERTKMTHIHNRGITLYARNNFIVSPLIMSFGIHKRGKKVILRISLVKHL